MDKKERTPIPNNNKTNEQINKSMNQPHEIT